MGWRGCRPADREAAKRNTKILVCLGEGFGSFFVGGCRAADRVAAKENTKILVRLGLIF